MLQTRYFTLNIISLRYGSSKPSCRICFFEYFMIVSPEILKVTLTAKERLRQRLINWNFMHGAVMLTVEYLFSNFLRYFCASKRWPTTAQVLPCNMNVRWLLLDEVFLFPTRIYQKTQTTITSSHYFVILIYFNLLCTTINGYLNNIVYSRRTWVKPGVARQQKRSIISDICRQIKYKL